MLSNDSGGIAVKPFYDDASAHVPILGQRMIVWASYMADCSRAGTAYFPMPNVQPKSTWDAIETPMLASTSMRSGKSTLSDAPWDSTASEATRFFELMTLESFLSTGYSFADGMKHPSLLQLYL